MQSNKRPYSLNIRGKIFTSDTPMIMGILNLTPDSFFEESRVNNSDEVLLKAEKMIREGADILDLGAQSTRPGAQKISSEEELKRLLVHVKNLNKEFPDAILSVDTWSAEVAKEAVQCGVAMVNDVSGGAFDENMFQTISALRVPYVLMHIKGEPSNMQKNPSYDDVVAEVVKYFSEKIRELRNLGVNDIILDPGFGFGKTNGHNLELLNQLDQLTIFGLPVMAGLSRKKTIQTILGVDAAGALNGTTVLNTIALMNGASILRVHDVAEAKQAVTLYASMKKY